MVTPFAQSTQVPLIIGMATVQDSYNVIRNAIVVSVRAICENAFEPRKPRTLASLSFANGEAASTTESRRTCFPLAYPGAVSDAYWSLVQTDDIDLLCNVGISQKYNYFFIPTLDIYGWI
jgi:hypothetical protein